MIIPDEFEDAVLACSALKKLPERLAQGIHDFAVVYLHGSSPSSD